MKTWIRRALWSLAVLLGLPLLMALMWWLLNSRDVPAQPWPEALALPRNTLAPELNAHAMLAAAPALQGEFRLERCEDMKSDCLAAWRTQLPKMAAQRQANAGFGAVCEAVTARSDLRYEDPLPETMRIDSPFVPVKALVDCHNWWLSLALEAFERGDAAAALEPLQRADRLDRAMLQGSRILVAQQVAAALFGRKLLVAQALATAHPAEAPALAPLVALDAAAHLERQATWMRVEANYQRAATDSLRTSACEGLAGDSVSPQWLCRVTASGAQPEYTTQLMAGHWLAALGILQATKELPAALPALRERFAAEGRVSLWQRVRHTVPHVLDDVARPALQAYFERGADLQLAAEATGLWLKDPSKAWAERASPALRERLTWRDGAWHLTAHDSGSVGRMPLAWRSPT